MFRYINKYHLFASVASYLLSNIRTDSKKYMLQRIFTSEQIFAQDFRILSNICFKIFVRSEYYQTFKGTVPRDFRLRVFFHESVSPKPLSIPIEPFRIFSKIRGDIRSSRYTTGVADTGGKWQKSSN